MGVRNSVGGVGQVASVWFGSGSCWNSGLEMKLVVVNVGRWITQTRRLRVLALMTVGELAR